MKVDDGLKFEGTPTLLLTYKKQDKKSCTITKKTPALLASNAYVFGFYFMLNKDFIKAKGRIFVELKHGKKQFLTTWRGKLTPNSWHYMSIRLDAKSKQKAILSIIARGTGGIRIAKPGFTKISHPATGIKLVEQYLKLPFGTLAGEEIQDNLNIKTGTIEFWLQPHWEEKSGRRFAEKNIRALFFWGEDNRYNSISLWAWNKFPNIYFSYAGNNRKTCSSVLVCNCPRTGWKKDTWHHLAVSWKQNKDKPQLSFFVDGMPIPPLISKKTEINASVKLDMFLGIGKYHRTLDMSRVANSSFALFRISNNVRYTKPFIPASDYKVDKQTMCFFPLTNDKDLTGLILLKDGKTQEVKAKLRKITKKESK
jgi:hypothetical protein